MHSTAIDIDTKDMLVTGSAQFLPSSSLQQTNKLQHGGSVVKKKKKKETRSGGMEVNWGRSGTPSLR